MSEPLTPMTAAEFEAITDAAEIVDASQRIALALRERVEAIALLQRYANFVDFLDVEEADVPGVAKELKARAAQLLKGGQP